MKTLLQSLLTVATTTILLMLCTNAWAQRNIRPPAGLPGGQVAETVIRDRLTPPGDLTIDTVIWYNHRPPGDLTNGMRIKIREGASETLTVPNNVTVNIISDGAVTNLSTIRIRFGGATSAVNWEANYTHTNRSGTAVVLSGEAGTLNVSGAIKTTGTGHTINSMGNVTINVTDGLVKSGRGIAIRAVMGNATTINISGGVVKATTGQAIVLNTNPNARHTFEVSGGLVIAEGTEVVGTGARNVISHEPTRRTGGFIIARPPPRDGRFYKGKNAVYVARSEATTAVWTLQNNVSGILVNGTDFFPLPGVQPRIEIPQIRNPRWFRQHKVHDTIVNFSLEFDTAQRHAVWVAYELTREHLKKNSVRKNNFKFDSLIPKEVQPHQVIDGKIKIPSYWSATGKYELGHLLPSADRKFSQEARNQTNFMSNISPHLPNFHGCVGGHGVWCSLEYKVRKWAKLKEVVALYVVKGGAIIPGAPGTKVKVLDTINTVVPEYYFKALVQRRKDSSFHGIAFWLKQYDTMVRRAPTQADAITIRKLEYKTRINFFPSLSVVGKKLEPKNFKLEKQVETTIPKTKEEWKRLWPGIEPKKPQQNNSNL